jgi:hypothetical protein
MTAAGPAPDAARRELEAAELLLRSMPETPDAAWVHLDRAAEMLGDAQEAPRPVDARAAWRRLDQLQTTAGRLDRSASHGRRLGRWIVAGICGVVLVGATMLVMSPRVTRAREVGRGAVEGALGGSGSTSVEAGHQLVVHLGSAWNADSFGIAVRHRRPCRLTLLRRGRPQWSTVLSGDGEWAVHRYEVAVPERVQRRGFEQLLITPDPADEIVEIGELRLDPP